MFWDPRVGGHRVNHSDCIYEAADPIHFGPKFCDVYPLRLMSVTIGIKGADITSGLVAANGIYVTHAFTARRHPPRSGGLSAPRPPFERLSTQTRVLLARRSAQSAANAAAATRALAAGVQASVRHAPPRTDPSDDEYEPEF